MRKKTWVLFIIVFAALQMGGCSAWNERMEQPASPAANTVALPLPSDPASIDARAETTVDEPYVIGFTMLGEEATFFQIVKNGVLAAADRYGVKLLYAVNDRIPQEMEDIINGFVADGADIIVDFTVLPEPGNTIAAELKRENIPMISVDCLYDEAYFFGIDNQQAGEKIGRFLATEIMTRWNGQVDAALILYAEVNGETVKKRVSGAYDGLIDSGIALDSSLLTYTSINTPSSKQTNIAYVTQLVSAYLEKHPDESHIAIIGASDDIAIGALAAVQAAGREDECLIVSHNCDPSAIENLKKADTCWIGSVNYAPDSYGEQIVKVCVDLLNGVEYDQEIFIDTYVVSIYNVNEYFPD